MRVGAVEGKGQSMEPFDDMRARGRHALVPERVRIAVGMGTCARIARAKETLATLERAVGNRADVVAVGCEGLCWAEPLVSITWPRGVRRTYGPVLPEYAEKLAETALRDSNSQTGSHGLESHPALPSLLESSTLVCDEHNLVREADAVSAHPSFEQRVISHRCGFVRPDSLEEYAATGGLFALERLASDALAPEEALKAVEASGLRGLGGAGFPTGRKWRAVFDNPDPVKFVIANGDEGDPGAYMDRSLMEGDPFAIIEGMTLAGLSLGAEQGFVFLRSEYRLAFKTMRTAVVAARKAGILGESVAGTGRRFDIEIVRSGGSYLCGEATALVNALENRAGTPRPVPPHLAEKGLLGHPTLLNNIETFANIPFILSHGAAAFRARGTHDSPGTKLLCVAGSIGRTGIAEVGFSTPLSAVTEAFSNPTQNETPCKAVQIGGPSGVIAAAEDDVRLDFETLEKRGGIMGSGGIVLLSSHDCIVETVRHNIAFLASQSCGRCDACRTGLAECAELLDGLTKGCAPLGSIERLRVLAEEIPAGSACGLGKASTRGLASALASFEAEFEAHLAGSCPALSCEGLIRFEVVDKLCPGCRCCLPTCPSNAMRGRIGKPFRIDARLCEKCWMCVSSCPYYAVIVKTGSSCEANKPQAASKRR